eukprot:scaffold44963_cov20-Tisochrysis_lutea.AAC.1
MAYTLNFDKRIKIASVKNLQLVSWDHNSDAQGENVMLQFGKLGEDLFALDFGYPFTIESAFALGEWMGGAWGWLRVSTQSGMAKGEHSIFVRYKGSRSSAVADKHLRNAPRSSKMGKKSVAGTGPLKLGVIARHNAVAVGSAKGASGVGQTMQCHGDWVQNAR